MDVGLVLYNTIMYFFNIVSLLILARIILSWLPQYRQNRIVEMIYGITDPILSPFQRIIPPMGMMDLSPMVAIIALIILEYVLLAVVENAFGLALQ